MSVELTDEQVDRLSRLAATMERREQTGDWLADTHFEAVVDRPWVLIALVSLAPKQGEKWTEAGLLLWLEVVEKSARMVYGLRHDWMDNLCPDPAAHSGPEERRETAQPVEGSKLVADADGLAAKRVEAQQALADAEPSVDPASPAPEEPVVEPDEPAGDSEDPDPTPDQPGGDEDDEPAAQVEIGKTILREWASGDLELVLRDTLKRLRQSLTVDDLGELVHAAPAAVTEALGPLVASGEVRRYDAGDYSTYYVPSTPVKDQVLAELTPDGSLTKEEIMEAIGTRQGVGAALAHMVKAGSLTLEDERYRLPTPADHSQRIRSNGTGSTTCAAKDCILAARLGGDYCEEHQQDADRVVARVRAGGS